MVQNQSSGLLLYGERTAPPRGEYGGYGQEEYGEPGRADDCDHCHSECRGPDDTGCFDYCQESYGCPYPEGAETGG